MTLHPDLADLEARVILEADSWEFHTCREALVRDCWRYNEFVAEQWPPREGKTDFCTSECAPVDPREHAEDVVGLLHHLPPREAQDQCLIGSSARRSVLAPILVTRMGWPGDRVTNRETGRCRGRSGLHRTRWWVTPTRGNPRDQCHRKQTAVAPRSGGKGETVVQETTSAAGDRRG